MSEVSGLFALKTLLETSTVRAPLPINAPPGYVPPGPLNTLVRVVYLHIFPVPYRGAYPFATVALAPQASTREAYGVPQQKGLYTITYYDELANRSEQEPAQVMQAAMEFAVTLRQAIRQDPTVGGVFAWAGEDAGIITHYNALAPIEEVAMHPLYQLPIDLMVLDQPEDSPY